MPQIPEKALAVSFQQACMHVDMLMMSHQLQLDASCILHVGFHILTISLRSFHVDYSCDNQGNDNDNCGDRYGDVDSMLSYDD